MLLESPYHEPAADLLTTTIATQISLTPVDDRHRCTPESSPMPEVGTILLNRWRLLAWAGLGSANVVFRGEHAEMPLAVAIKIVNRLQYHDRALVISHLRNEAQMLARLRHPNLARLWDFHEDGEFPFLITDFIDGRTLRQVIGLERRLDPRWAIRAAIHIVGALGDVWREGIIHRDVKPENIVLCVDGTAKLIDFGLAMRRGMESPVVHGARLESPRVGTVAYLAPEQARNSAAVDHRADIYSLGATLYHAVTGRLPFLGNNATQVILRHIEDEPVPPKAIVPGMHEAFSDLILRMMAKRPHDRFHDADELLATLEDVQTELGR